jgi:STE24 endopeptidase
MKLNRFLLGMGAGLGVGYLAVRYVQAWKGRETHVLPLTGDAAKYGRERRALAVANMARSVAGTLAFAYGPLAEQLDRGTRRLPVWLRPGAVAAAAFGVGSIVELPAEFVEDYLLEQRYGLTEQTSSGWLADQFKTIAVGCGVTGLLGALGGAALRLFPRAWPAIASLGTLPLLVLANVLVPVYFLPMFNRFEPVRGHLESRLRALADKLGVGDAEILRMDMSRQTKKANAFVTGIGNTHRIVLGDTLIERFQPEEIEFVVAHELGHYVTKDTWRFIAVSELTAAALFFLASRFEHANGGARSMLRIYALLATGSQLVRPAVFAFSRSREWAADRFAIDVTRDPRSGAEAFRRLRDQNLAEDDVPYWYEFFFGSHPSLGKRIAALGG